jgi:predicted enzyme related to lactoylglutathione lyase
MLASDPSVVGGALVRGPGVAPSKEGTLVYLNGGADLDVILARVQPAGGVVETPKTAIGNDFGFFALFIDSEGNKVGLHSMG